jgi:hypothetical protein
VVTVAVVIQMAKLEPMQVLTVETPVDSMVQPVELVCLTGAAVAAAVDRLT